MRSPLATTRVTARIPWLALLTAAAAFLLACSSSSSDAAALPANDSQSSLAKQAAATTADATSEATATATRLASHLFLSVGDQRTIEGYGELLEVLHISEVPAVSVEGLALTAEAGGISCLRFQYRDVDQENGRQTLCVVAFDETGSCDGLTPLALNLRAYLNDPNAPEGDANLLASGAGRFYATCRTASGAYRLQQPGEPLPQPYFHLVDALGSGPYALGDDETNLQRAGAIETFSGETLQTPWIVTVSREVEWIELTADGFETNIEDCSAVPSCSPSDIVIQTGDILRYSMGINLDQVAQIAPQTNPALLDTYLQDRLGLSWENASQLSNNSRDVVLLRLLSLDVMDDALDQFDGLYRIRERDITVAYMPYWAVQELTNLCNLDEVALCATFEDALRTEEERRIGALQAKGFTLWLGAPLNYDPEANYVSVERVIRPHISLFDGVLAWTFVNESFTGEESIAAVTGAVTAFAAELDPEQPVLLMLPGPPLTAQTGGAFCEAEICPSDFSTAYTQIEAWLGAALDTIPREQFVGFGLAMFDGAHFDIREPYEQYEFYDLNRVGETGYNHPVSNIYRAQ